MTHRNWGRLPRKLLAGTFSMELHEQHRAKRREDLATPFGEYAWETGNQTRAVGPGRKNMNIYQMTDEEGVRHTVFAQDDDDAAVLVEEGVGHAVHIDECEELSIMDAALVKITKDDGSKRTLATEYEIDPGRRYVACSEW